MNESVARYGLAVRCLHWIMAVLMIGLLWLGWHLVGLDYSDRWFYTSLEWHKALGMMALVVGVAKIACAVASQAPPPLASTSAWERALTFVVRVLLYFMLVAVPVTGYLISTSAGDGISMFGWFDVPAVLPRSDWIRDLAVELHFYLAYTTAILVAIHVLAALKHHFVDRDATLRRML